MSVYVATMLKGLGVAFISEICAGICRDFGKSTLADGVELAGKLEIILLCVPMITEIVGTASELLGRV